MIDGSPAWKPQATLAEVISPSSSASGPPGHAPNPSPTSLLRSTARPIGLDGGRSGIHRRGVGRRWRIRHRTGRGRGGRLVEIAGDVVVDRPAEAAPAIGP